jgi:cytochrome P450
MSIEDGQLTDPDFFATGDPHAVWKRLRAEDPVHWTKGKLSFGFWSVTRHADVLAVYCDSETFSSQLNTNILPASVEAEASMHEGGGERLSMSDDPLHGAMRRAFNRLFLPGAVARFEERGRRLVDRVIDQIGPRGECDLMTDIALKMPIEFIFEMMQIPAVDWDELVQLSNALTSYEDPEFRLAGSPLESKQRGFASLFAYTLRLALERRRNPANDLLSMLGAARIDGSQLTERQLGSNGILFLSGGFETTGNAIAGGMLELIKNHDQRERLRTNPALMRTAVEEILRWTTPVTHNLRTATRDTELRGRRIRKGERVVVWTPSANRDEEAFPDADCFDVARTPNEHLTFGRGRHFCLGAHLARLEIGLTIERLLERLPDLGLNGPVERVCSNMVAGPKHVPVKFTPIKQRPA